MRGKKKIRTTDAVDSRIEQLKEQLAEAQKLRREIVKERQEAEAEAHEYALSVFGAWFETACGGNWKKIDAGKVKRWCEDNAAGLSENWTLQEELDTEAAIKKLDELVTQGFASGNEDAQDVDE